MISYLDAGRIPLNIYIDLSKAFDTLDHTILLDYGIRDTELQLIKDYLSNVYQLTEENGYKCKPLKIKTGVPQGSVLVLFYFCCILTISLTVDFFLKWSCFLMILPCIVILIVVTLKVQ